MLVKISSASLAGIDAKPIEIEVDISPGLPGFIMVGLPDASVKESKERVRAALKNCGYFFPSRKITINLAPADQKKEGAAFDLPISLGFLAYLGLFPQENLDSYLFLGELALDGRLKPIRGSLSAAVMAERMGFRGLVLPRCNAKEACLVKGLDIFGMETISEVIAFLNDPSKISPVKYSQPEDSNGSEYQLDFKEIKGQQHVKRGLEVATAGGHNILMIGPPGAGKTMLARRLPTILPPLSYREMISVTKIYSATGLLQGKGLMTERPFRAPHHTITDAGLIGGGIVPKPGEVTLAHQGVLFLDELPEFKKSILENLRQPLESGYVVISRASMSIVFPCLFMLVGAMNPFEDVYGFGGGIGRGGGSGKTCYSRISRPLLDRIDIQVEVPKLDFRDIVSKREGESSSKIRSRVLRARKRQKRRFHPRNDFTNHRMNAEDIRLFCQVDAAGRRLLENAVDRFGLSMRAYTRILKVSRTIADLMGEEDVRSVHISEAIQYRMIDRFELQGISQPKG